MALVCGRCRGEVLEEGQDAAGAAAGADTSWPPDRRRIIFLQDAAAPLPRRWVWSLSSALPERMVFDGFDEALRTRRIDG